MNLVRKFLHSTLLLPLVIKIDQKINSLRTQTDLLHREPINRAFNHFINKNYTYGSEDFGPDAQSKAGKNVFFITDLELNPELRKYKTFENLETLSNEEIRNSVFYVYFSTDSKAFPVVKRIIECGGTFVPHLNPSKTDYRFTDSITLETLMEVRARKDFDVLSLANIHFHENICEALSITRNKQGSYVEIGVFKGHSLLTASTFINKIKEHDKSFKRPIFGLDTFHGFDYSDSKESSDIIWHKTHIVDEPDVVKQIIIEKISSQNVELKLITCNIIIDQLPEVIGNIAVAVVDVDLFEATQSALSKLDDKIVSGGIIVCEDAASTPQLYGAYVAMENFLLSPMGKKYIKIFKKGSYFLIKQ